MAFCFSNTSTRFRTGAQRVSEHSRQGNRRPRTVFRVELRRVRRKQLVVLHDGRDFDGDLENLVLVLEQLVHRTDGEEALVARRILRPGVEDVGGDDGRQILQVHLAAGFLVDVREGGDPFEEDEEDLDAVPMRFREKAGDEVECP